MKSVQRKTLKEHLKKLQEAKYKEIKGSAQDFYVSLAHTEVVNFAHSVQSLVNSVLLRAKIVLCSLLLMTETELLVTSPFHLSSHARLLSLSPPLSLSVPPRLS